MKNLFTKLVLLLLVLSTSACASRIALSEQVREENNLTAEQLKTLQVYVSDTITLERLIDSSGSTVDKSGVLELYGEKREQVIIKPSTPGIITEVFDSYVKVSFSEGTELIFGLNTGAKKGDPWAGKYALYADKWQGEHGILSFKGDTYRAIRSSSIAVLEVNKKQLKAIDIEKVELSGIRLR
jgi:hypothetical protein